MKKYLLLILLVSLIVIIGCERTYDNIDAENDSVKPIETKQSIISSYKVNGSTSTQKETINSIIDKTTEAMDSVSSIEVATVSSDSDTSDYIDAVYDAAGVALVLKYGDKFIQYTEVKYSTDSTTVSEENHDVIIETYAAILANKAISYQKLSNKQSEGTWVESDITYNDTYSLGLFISQFKEIDNNNISLYEDEDLYYIAANIKLYDYYCYSPVQLSYSQELANLLATDNKIIPIIVSIDKSNYLISATFAEKVNYSDLDSSIETEKGNEFNYYHNYNALSNIQVPSEIDLDKIK